MPGYGCRLRRRRLRLRQAVKGTLGASRCSCLGSVGLLSPRIRRDERGPSADEDEEVQPRQEKRPVLNHRREHGLHRLVGEPLHVAVAETRSG